MNLLLKIASYLFHPLLTPLMGAIMYYSVSPRFLEPDLVKAKLLAVAIITLFIPIVVFFLLKNIGLVDSIHLKEVKERKYPLMIQCGLILLVIKMIYNPYDDPEMYYLFVGILFSTISALIMVLCNVKVSLHQIGIAGLLAFLIGLSVHFKINLLLSISFFLFANGWVASSRLHDEAHTPLELSIGFVVGLLPQLILFNFWL